MKKKTIPWIVSAGTGAVSAFFALHIRIFSSVTFERKPILNLFKDGPRELKGIAKEGQDWLHEHDHHIVTMTNREGLKLRGHYFPAENAKRTVIEFHGWHSNWDVDFSASAPYLHELGSNLLIIEERGQGESEGDYMTFGLKERFDVMDWVTWYQENMDCTIPIYLAGLSMGATTVLMAASEVFPEEVKGILADCGFTSPYEIIRLVGKRRFHTPQHPSMDGINLYCKWKIGIDLKSWSTLQAVEQATLPILFVHGTEDHFVPCEMTVQAYEHCTSDKDILLVDGAGHGASFVKAKEEYLNKVKAFLKRCEEK